MKIRAGDLVRLKSGGSLCFRVIATREQRGEVLDIRAPWGEWYVAGYFKLAEPGDREATEAP